MSFTLQYFPASGGAPTTDTFAGWGFEKSWGGSFRSMVADQLNLTIAKDRAAVLDTFEARSQFIVRDELGNIFFQGTNGSDGKRKGTNKSTTVTLTLSGPWWYLEGLPFSRNVTTDYWSGGAVGVGTHVFINSDFTAFNLNRALDGTYMAARAMLIEILNFAIGKGAPFQFNSAEIFDLAILPQPFQNGTCANAIRSEVNDVDAVIWFDHSTTPPTLHIKQTTDCVSVSRTLGPLNQVTDFDLTRRDDLRVPFVSITFQAGVVLNGTTFPQFTTFSYPTPLPTGIENNFYPFVATVPLNPLILNSTSARLYTMEITQDLTWLKKVRPEYDPAQNPQAANDYQNLAIVSFTRQTAFPRMLVPESGNYASWMGGNFAKENITVVLSYARKVVGALSSKIQQHTISIPVRATDINADSAAGQLFTNTTVKAVGENPADFSSLAQTIYTSLNTPCYEGFVKCLEPSSRGWVQMGNVLNLLGDPSICRPEWNTMRALVHEVSFETNGSAEFFVTVTTGVNKKLSTGQLRERIEAKRLLQPELSFNYAGGVINSSGGSPEVPDQRAGNGITDGPPGYEEHIIYSPPASDGSRFLARISSDGQGGQPIIEVKKVDNTGAVVPAVPQIALAPNDMTTAVAGTKAQMRDWGGGTFVLSTAVPNISGIKQYKITALGGTATGDRFTAREWDGTTLGTVDIIIAKPYQLRTTLAAEVVDGVALTYTYTDDNNRVAKDPSGNVEIQVVSPRWTVGTILFAGTTANGTGITSAATGHPPILFLDINDDARRWLHRYAQS